MIRTELGPVDLRRPRQHAEIKLSKAGDGKTTQIKAKWLVKGAKGKVDDLEHTQIYRSGVMQAMMIACTQMELADLAGRPQVDPETGMLRTPEKTAKHKQRLDGKLESLRSGKVPVPMRRLSVIQGVTTQQVYASRHHLLKRGQKIGMVSTRFFALDGGKLKEFKGERSMKAAHIYDLRDVEARYEHQGMKGVSEEFGDAWPHRVKVQLRDRPHGPLYLATQDPRQAKSWERAIKMSKYLQSASDREALAFVVGRLAGSVMNKGWQALFAYAKEMKETKQLVKNLAMRLMRVDLSRGWTKARLVYLQKIESEKLRQEQKEWAAKFLKEKLERINTQSVRSPQQVRMSIVSQVQTKFRHFRQEKIFDRAYPLGSAVATRLQQAQAGATRVASFKSTSRDDALHLVLNNDSREHLTASPAVFHGRKSTYSEVTVPPGQLHINVSESFAMLSFAELDEEAEHSHLAKEGWAHYVNLDQISSVILHTERVMNFEDERPDLDPATTSGVWFTINGPRVCWCRQLRTTFDATTQQGQRDVVGAANPLVVGSVIARGERLRWLKVAVQVRNSQIPKRVVMQGEEHTEFMEAEAQPKERQVFMRLFVLGRTFKSERMPGESVIFPGRYEVEVPISFDEQALAAFDESEVVVDIVEWNEVPQKCETIFAGRVKLWKVFAPGDGSGQIVSLAQTLNTSAGRSQTVVSLVPPNVGNDKFVMPLARVELEVTARIQESTDPLQRCISPELHGRGSLTTLFTTHRGAWYDPKLGDSKFAADRVANFIEVTIMDLTFPEIDVADPTRLFKYHVLVTCNGVRASTLALWRAREVWQRIMPVDPQRLDYKRTKLFLPLPPGAWCSHDIRPEIDVQVIRSAHVVDRGMSFDELIRQNGKPGPSLPTSDRMYHATVLLDGLLVDEEKKGARIFLSKATAQKTVVSLANGECSQVEHPAELRIDAALRDRDYVRLNAARRSPGSARGEGLVLAVGDKAMLKVEEPLIYPQTDLEFRRRCLPGTFDSAQAARGPVPMGWSAPLRDPSLSHEYTNSLLETVPGALPFKQRYLPTNCEDLIPYKYLLPPSEFDFQAASRPGVFWRVADRLAEQMPQTQDGARIAPPPAIVKELTHLVRNLPCTLLAVYANDTCDLELSPAFVDMWERHPDWQYAIPGAVVVKKFQDTSQAAMRSAPVGSGDVSERYRLRVVLREVPVSCIESVQPASFNIYDASFGSVEDAIKVPPGKIGNDFNPRGLVDFGDHGFATGRKGGYSVHAGPVPADAGPTCLYEWSLHLHAETEDDMYHFVTSLRQSVRIDLHYQLLRLNDWERKSALSNSTMPYRSTLMTSSAGHLEVLLVEAKHLLPPKVRKHNMDLWMHEPGEAAMVTYQGMMELTPKAVFKFIRLNKLNGKMDEMVYRGSKTQTSPEVNGSSPKWCQVEELKSSGGWVFKTPPFEPKGADEEYFFEIEFFKAKISLCKVRVPVKGLAPIFDESGNRKSSVQYPVDLCSPDIPFHNIWVPLSKEGETHVGLDDPDKPFMIPFGGKAHLMTFWVPQQENPKNLHLPKKAMDFRRYQLKPKLAFSALREHLDEVAGVLVQQEEDGFVSLADAGMNFQNQMQHSFAEVHVKKQGYNPNLCVEADAMPPTRADEWARHVEEMDDSVPYLECHEGQDMERWAKFEHTAMAHDRTLSELMDLGQHDFHVRRQLEDMFRLGVPRHLRKSIWFQVTHADRLAQFCQEGWQGAGRPSLGNIYRELVTFGRQYPHEAIRQLSEDLMTAAAWEQVENPNLMDQHLARIARAQDICSALIAYPDKVANHPAGFKGAGYCESLLILSFYMLLAVALPQPGTSKGPSTEEREQPFADHSDLWRVGGVEKVQTHTLEDIAKACEEQRKSNEREEARIFFMLYALAGFETSPFRDYYGARMAETPWPLRKTPMDDIRRLDCILARKERELWVRLNALGFHLAQVFYGAFMRLFATYMPTTSVFRFWDLLFHEAAMTANLDLNSQQDILEQKPARHSLIDLAYGTITRCKAKLMTAKSALEVKSILVDYLEKLYDPSDAIALVNEAEALLWNQQNIVDKVQVHAIQQALQADHNRDFWRSTNLWDMQIQPFRLQNVSLKELVDKKIVTVGKAGLNCRKLRGLFASENVPRDHFIGMQHCISPQILRLGPEIDASWLGYFSNAFSRLTETFDVRATLIARSIPCVMLPELVTRSLGEATQMDGSDFERMLRRIIGEEWSSELPKLFQAFVSQTEKRLSVNEFFGALICASKGTVGEKAMELFKLYATVLPKHTMHHLNTVTHAAATIVDKIENSGRQMAEGRVARAPAEAHYKNHALYFQVWTHMRSSQDLLMGESFIPSLRPYLWNAMGKEEVHHFPIFGMEKRLPPGFAMNTANAAALLNEHGVRSQIGTMTMAIKWMPSSEAAPEIGQLGVRLFSIKFDSMFVEAHHTKNPKVCVFTYDASGEKQRIKRWDPRTMLKKGASAITADMLAGGAFGEHLEFAETMRRDPIKGILHKKAGSGHGIGWHPNEGVWLWNTKWGDQYSVDKFAMHKEWVKSTGDKPNVISLRACRLITKDLLSRTMDSVTNRQMMLLSDATFSRCGAVPGILDAILVQAEFVNATYESATQLRKALDSARRQYVDVTHQVVLCHETTVDDYPGDSSLFPGREESKMYSLAAMEITDPFPGIRKVLWVRYARGGDGERMNAAIQVNPDGTFQGQDLPLDMAMTEAAGKVQMFVTRDEFVTCVLNSPLFSEALRKLTIQDYMWKATDENKAFHKAMNLEVIISDPAREAEEEDFMDAMNARQGIMLELWDYDVGKKDDFLGEAWLPPLSELTAEPRAFILPVKSAPTDDDPDHPTMSRPDKQKFKNGGPIECCGNIFVEAAWRFPSEELPENDDGTLEGRVKKAEMMHTGELYVKIIKAEGLRLADRRMMGLGIASSLTANLGSDPYCYVYVRNEALSKGEAVTGMGPGGWRKSVMTGFDEPIMKTNWKRSTRNPVWEEEKKILLQTGAFEKRTTHKLLGTAKLDITGRSQKKHQDAHAIDVIHGLEDLHVHFNAGGQKAAKKENEQHHQQLVYMSDTIHQFKDKLREACREEARHLALQRSSAEEVRKQIARYEDASRGISYRHAVMVFVPSQRLRELAQQLEYTKGEQLDRTAYSGKEFEYQRLYRLEEKDPSSWQPLDTIRTFDHYKALYGFGLDRPQRLRIVEGTEDYKMRNARYRQFCEAQTLFNTKIENFNTESECYGWARYTHKYDGNSVEWRQALLDRPELGADGVRRARTWFIHNVLSGVAHTIQVPGQAPKVELEMSDVLLAPANPKIMASGHAEHQEFLDKAKDLREQHGLKDTEIAARLNAEMKEKFAGVGGGYGGMTVEAISVSDVQHVLKRDEMISAAARPRRASAFGELPGMPPGGMGR